MPRLVLIVLTLMLACGGSNTPPHAVAPPSPDMPAVTAPSAPDRTPVELGFPKSSDVRVAYLDPDGELLIAPSLRAPKSFGNTELSPGVHLVKLRRSGTVRWSHELTKNTEGYITALTVDTLGTIYVAGSFARTLKAGDLSLESAGDMDAFVASFETDGTPRWMHSLGGPAREVATSLSIDEDSSRLAIGGWAESTFAFNGRSYRGRGSAKHGFTAVYSLLGEPQWAQRIAGRGLNRVRAVSLDQDSLVVLGTFADRLDLGNEPVQSAGDMDIFCARFYPDGELDWVRTWGSDKWDEAAAMRMGADGRITLAGSSSGALKLSAELLPARGRSDVLLWQMNRDGDPIESLRLGGDGDDIATQLSQDGPLRLLGFHRWSTNLGFGDLDGGDDPQAFAIALDEQLRVTRTERPPFEQVFQTAGRSVFLGRTADGPVLRY